MNNRRLQGMALILSAVCMLMAQFGNGSSFFHVIALIGTVLFILGIPALYAAQPGGSLGLIGIVLIELAAVIALGFQLDLLNSSALVLTSAIAGLIGDLLIGWITTQNHVFPAWIGWAFIAEGMLNFIGGRLQLGSLSLTYSFVLLLLNVIVLFGYGYFLNQTQSR